MATVDVTFLLTICRIRLSGTQLETKFSYATPEVLRLPLSNGKSNRQNEKKQKACPPVGSSTTRITKDILESLNDLSIRRMATHRIRFRPLYPQ